MQGRAWIMVVAALLFAPPVRAQILSSQTLTSDEIVIRMMQHDAERRAELTKYNSERTYHMEYKGPIGERSAQMRVKMEFSAPDRKSFTVVAESGSTIFCHKILRKLMEGEQEGALEANHLRSMLSPANYSLKLVGEETLDGVSAWVLDVTPKDENRFSYKGRVWVSKGDYAMIRVLGSPAKNPSFLMGNSKFDYRYARSGNFWLPERNDSVSHLRIGGDIKLTVDYGQYRIVTAAPSGAAIAAENRGSGTPVKARPVSLPE